MNPISSQSDSILRDNVRLYVDFRDGELSQVLNYIDQFKRLARNVGASA